MKQKRKRKNSEKRVDTDYALNAAALSFAFGMFLVMWSVTWQYTDVEAGFAFALGVVVSVLLVTRLMKFTLNTIREDMQREQEVNELMIRLIEKNHEPIWTWYHKSTPVKSDDDNGGES